MKKKLSGYLISKYSYPGKVYSFRRFLEEAENLDIDLREIGVADCTIINGKVYFKGELLPERDFAIVRYYVPAFTEALCRLVKKQYNNTEIIARFRNKYNQISSIKSDYFKQPKSILGSASTDYEFLQSKLGLPFIAKGLESYGGQQIFLIRNIFDYDSLKFYFNDAKEFLYQQFISESRGEDIRIFVVKGETVAAMQRTSDGDFRSNHSLGGSSARVEISDELRNIGMDIFKQTGIDFVGVELLKGSDGLYFCEINTVPGFESLDMTNDINLAKIMLEVIKLDFSEGNI
ncbi:MAG: RimK family alpha-L-glutamate ligase [Erysipelotrichaceae bacterium]|nr:RimK family alpha-L-glutamate ligase [Erysipelotrichaceae bacterium]